MINSNPKYERSEEINLKNQFQNKLLKSSENYEANFNIKFTNEKNTENKITTEHNQNSKEIINQESLDIYSQNTKNKNDENETEYISSPKPKKINFFRFPSQTFIRKSIRVQKHIQEESAIHYDLDSLGKIEYAKMHRNAYRPLHKLKEFTPDIKFCQCCNLPVETKGYIEKFSMFEKTDKFSECGIAISQYFFFFKYAICCTLIVCIICSIPIMILNGYYSKQLNKLCNNYFDYISKEIPFNMTKCLKFIRHAKGSEYYINETDWALKYSSDTMKAYLIISNVTTGSFDNVNKVVLNYSVLNFCCVVTLFIVNIYYIMLTQTLKYEINFKTTSPSDYTICITNLEQSLLSYIKKNRKNKDIVYLNEDIIDKEKFIKYLKDEYLYDGKNKIESINLCYKLKEYMQLKKEYEDVKYKIFQVKYNPRQIELNRIKNNYENLQRYFSFLSECRCCCCKDKGITLEELNSQKEKLEKKIDEIEQGNQKLSELNFAGCVFVTFNTMKEKENYYAKFPHSILSFFYFYIKNLHYFFCACCANKNNVKKFRRRKKMTVSNAPEPEDVIWENLDLSFLDRAKRGIIIYLVTIVLIFIAFAVVLALTYLQNYSNDHDWKGNTLVKYGVSLIITCVISGTNLCFRILLNIFTKFERHISMTNYYLSFSVKLSGFTFLTSAVVPTASNYVQNSLGENEILVNNMLMMFLVNSFVTPILWTFNFTLILKTIKIWLIESRIAPDLHHYKTQKELNDIYELPDMEISYKYSHIIKTLMMTFFYIPIFPFGAFISFVGLIFGYFLELYNFTHIYKKPEMINEKLCKFYIDYFVINLFVLCVGGYMFMYETYEKDNWSFINIIIFGVLVLIPYPKLFNGNYRGVTESQIKTQSLGYYYFSFYNDYERQNPLTRKDGLITYVKKLYQYKKITKRVYNIAINNIENSNIMEIYYNLSQIKLINESESPSSYRNVQSKSNNVSTRKIKKIKNLNNEIQKNKKQDNQKIDNKEENIKSDEKITINSKKDENNEEKENIYENKIEKNKINEENNKDNEEEDENEEEVDNTFDNQIMRAFMKSIRKRNEIKSIKDNDLKSDVKKQKIFDNESGNVKEDIKSITFKTIENLFSEINNNSSNASNSTNTINNEEGIHNINCEKGKNRDQRIYKPTPDDGLIRIPVMPKRRTPSFPSSII